MPSAILRRREPSLVTRFAAVVAGALLFPMTTLAENPGEFRPQPIKNPNQKVGATGDKIQPADTLPQSRAPVAWEARRKPKLAKRGQPELRGGELVFNAGWELAEAPQVKQAGAELSQ